MASAGGDGHGVELDHVPCAWWEDGFFALTVLVHGGFVGLEELLVTGQGLDGTPFVAAGDAGAVSSKVGVGCWGVVPVLGPDTLAAHDFAF